MIQFRLENYIYKITEINKDLSDVCIVIVIFLWPRLQKWFNFNPSMVRSLDPL